MGGVEFDQLQERPFDRWQRRVLRQEGVTHAAEQLLQLRGQLCVQVLADTREDEEQTICLRQRRREGSDSHRVSINFDSIKELATNQRVRRENEISSFNIQCMKFILDAILTLHLTFYITSALNFVILLQTENGLQRILKN